MQLMSCDDPAVQGLAAEVKRLKKENKKLRERVTALSSIEWAGYRPLLDTANFAKDALLARGVRYDRFECMFKDALVLIDRYRWLEANVKEAYVQPDRVNCEWAPDTRTKWEIPTLICSGPVGGMVPFGEAIDIARNNL